MVNLKSLWKKKSEKLLSFTRHEVIRDIINILKVESFAFNVTILKIIDGEMAFFLRFPHTFEEIAF